MVAKGQWPWFALGAVAVGGGFWAARRFLVRPDVEQIIPDEAFTQRTTGTTRDAGGQIRRALDGGPKLAQFAAGSLSYLHIKIPEPKYVISYNPDRWDKSGRLRTMFNDGQVISLSRAEKLFKSTYGELPIYGYQQAIITPTDEWAKFAVGPLLLGYGNEAPGVRTAKVKNYGDTIKVIVAPGSYVITPRPWPYHEHGFKFFTKYWAFTPGGPRDLLDPDGPQPELAKEAIRRFMKDDCTKYFTYVEYRVGGDTLKSAKAVNLKPGETKRITLQQYIHLGIRKWHRKEAGSVAFNVWCEVTSRAVKLWLSTMGGGGGAIQAAAMKLLDIGNWKVPGIFG
ncbi:MAG: hypothetical protein ACYTBJ_00170 [Planctomycetota bacterium]|jgi:hypothetical protein